MKEKLLTQYQKVFDKNGNMKSCGRLECITLIQMCKTYAKENLNDTNTYFGNETNGFVDAENIKIFINNL